MDKKSIILVVDDEPFNVDYLVQELEDLDYDTVSAYNGKEALEKVEEILPDMILLDIMMPLMDGFEVLKRLKENSTFRDIPVVIISAMADMKSVVKGIELGAEDYLPKPFDPVILQARLTAGLERKNLKDVEKKYLLALEREFKIGQEMQAGFLPKELPKKDGWEISSFFKPARNVAGDFYDVFYLPEDNRIGIIVGDVCDKGLGAALYMTLFRSLLRALFWASDRITDIDYAQKLIDVISFVNNYICKIHNSASYATLFFGVLNTENGELTYVSAGHDPPIIVKENQIKTKIMPTSPLVGMIEDIEYKTSTLTIENDETLFLFTDGLPDVVNLDNQQFGQDRFEDSLKMPIEPLPTKTDKIFTQITDFIGDAHQYDDLTLVAVKKSN